MRSRRTRAWYFNRRWFDWSTVEVGPCLPFDRQDKRLNVLTPRLGMTSVHSREVPVRETVPTWLGGDTERKEMEKPIDTAVPEAGENIRIVLSSALDEIVPRSGQAASLLLSELLPCGLISS